jgi:hypothetical protein
MSRQLMLGLVLTGSAGAEAQTAADRPAALIDIGALTADSGLTVLMRTDVPEDVRRLALRRLW